MPSLTEEHGFIRQATPEQAAAVAECVSAAYEKYMGRIGREPAPMLADYAALIASGVVYVLQDDGGIKAVLVMILGDGFLLLENIAVRPASQRQGLGHQLMAFVEDRARASRLSEVRLYTNEAMTENLGFYARLGYEETDRRTEDGYRRVFMRKRLAG